MTNFKKQIFSVMTAGVMVLNLATPAMATTITVSGNGSDSDNEVKFEQEHTTDVEQYNTADVENKVNVTSNTGNNDAEDNTGGNVGIDTGDSKSTVSVNNTLNSNSADVDCCVGGDTDIEISGNGADSNNDVDVDRKNNVWLDQINEANVDNDVDVDSDTGNNDAEDNTGGDVTIMTGDADTTVRLSTVANANIARVGSASANGGSLSARILGNGADSDNDIDLDFDDEVDVEQWNTADVNNEVDVDSDTGDNDAEDNTGGDVIIDTGDADTLVTVDNMVNFNAAEVDCGCLLDDILAKVSGNGSDSDNKIELDLDSETEAVQGNEFDCAGKDSCADVDVDSDTGDNKAEDNTTQPDGDPSIETGDADTTVEVENSANSNVFGDLGDLELPDFGSLHLSFTFDLQDLLDLLNG